jgi:hypothetical protein
MERNKMDGYLSDITSSLEKLAPMEQNALLSQAVTNLIQKRKSEIKDNQERTNVLLGANQKLIELLKQES